MRIVVMTNDLMDRSRISAALGDVEFTTDPARAEGADVVVVDLARHAAVVASVRAAAPAARIVAFGPHVDTEGFAQASARRCRRGASPLALLPGPGRGAPEMKWSRARRAGRRNGIDRRSGVPESARLRGWPTTPWTPPSPTTCWRRPAPSASASISTVRSSRR